MTPEEFYLWEYRSRDAIDVKRYYIDVSGDLIAGVLLSQIIYWHLPTEDGETRLRVKRDGHMWLAKKRDDWWNECRITAKQFDRAAKVLEQKGLIATKVFKFAGDPIKHVRLNWDKFLGFMDGFKQTAAQFLPKGGSRSDSEGKSKLPDGKPPLTETPAENTSEISKTTTPAVLQNKKNTELRDQPKVVVSQKTEIKELQLNAEKEHLLEEAKELGVTVTKPLVKEILLAQLAIFRDALNALKEAKEQGKVESPVRYLMAALKEHWRPSEGYSVKPSAEFNEWFNWARSQRIVTGSMMIDGLLCVYTPTGGPHPWTEIAAQYPLEELRRRTP